MISLTSRVADRVPVRGGVVETARSNLLRQGVGEVAGVKLVRERRETAKADVQNHAERPNVDGLSILAILRLGKNLRRHIAGRSTKRGGERLFADNLSKTKVGKFDM